MNNPPLVALDGSIAPILSDSRSNTAFKAGLVWQARGGFFLHGGANYSFGTGEQTVGGVDFDQSAWGFDARIGWHPGVTPTTDVGARSPAAATATAATTTATTTASAEATTTGESQPGVQRPGDVHADDGAARPDGEGEQSGDRS